MSCLATFVLGPVSCYLLFRFPCVRVLVDANRHGPNQLPTVHNSSVKIVHARLGGSTEVLSGDTVKFVAMKVSKTSSDARRVLDICRCVPSIESTFFSKQLTKANQDGPWNSYNSTDVWREPTT